MTHKRTVAPVHPGEVLLELYLKERNIMSKDFAPAINVTLKHLSNVINGHVGITPEVAVKIGRALGTSPELWLNMQREFDVWEAQKELKSWKPSRRFVARAAAASV